MGERGPQKTLNGEQTFVWWYNAGERRTLIQVSDHFEVAYTTVRRLADDDDWNSRADELDAETRRQTDKRIAAIVSKHRASEVALVRHLHALFTKRIDPTHADALKPSDINVKEFIELGKFFELITGGATDRIDEGGGKPALSLDELERELEEIETRAVAAEEGAA